MLMDTELLTKICFLKGMAMAEKVFAIATAGNGASLKTLCTLPRSPSSSRYLENRKPKEYQLGRGRHVFFGGISGCPKSLLSK